MVAKEDSVERFSMYSFLIIKCFCVVTIVVHDNVDRCAWRKFFSRGGLAAIWFRIDRVADEVVFGDTIFYPYSFYAMYSNVLSTALG